MKNQLMFTQWSQSSRHRGQAMLQRHDHLWMPCVCPNSTILGMKMSDIIAEIGIAELPLPYQRLTGHKTHSIVQLTSATFFRSLQKPNWLRLISFMDMGEVKIKNNTLHRFKHFIRQEAATSARFCCMGGNTHLHRSLAWTPASFC